MKKQVLQVLLVVIIVFTVVYVASAELRLFLSPEQEKVVKIMEKWLSEHKSYQYTIKNRRHGLEIHCPVGVLCDENYDYRMFIYSDKKNYVSLGFNAAQANGISLESLKKKFTYIALDKLSLGLPEMKGWMIKGVTPTSSTKDAVTFVSYRDGIVKLRVKWSLYALYARNTTPECEPPADAPMKPECYALIRKNVPLDVTIDLPIQDQRVLDCRKTHKSPCGSPKQYHDLPEGQSDR